MHDTERGVPADKIIHCPSLMIPGEKKLNSPIEYEARHDKRVRSEADPVRCIPSNSQFISLAFSD